MLTDNDFIFHEHITDWGFTIYIMERSGLAFAKAYIFHDDSTTIYLSSLHVNECARRNGIGIKLQEIREQIGKEKGASNSVLWVKKDSWMRNWYKRRGYIDDVDKDESHIWMKKLLL